MRPLTSLTLEAMIALVSHTCAPIPDPRRPDRVDYRLHDTLMSGFAMMFFQYPKRLELQRNMQQRRHQCNLATIFGVREVPSDTQMRDILDGVPVELIRPLFPAVFEQIRRAGWATAFSPTLSSGADQDTYYTLMLDGSDYFPSTRIQCPSCLQRHDRSGEVHFRHTGVAGTLGKAGAHRGLPLDGEAVRNDDGHNKQDGESKAAKRLIPRVRHAHPPLALIVGGDALYCHAPCILQLREHRMHHVLVCKPGAPPEVYREGEAQDALRAVERGKWHEGPACRRRFYTSRLARGGPLTESGRVRGTFLEGWSYNRSGKQLYHNAWVTDLDVRADNVAEMVGIGRSRWKIEHEPCNVQKNHGDELTHTSGHGQRTLSMVFYVLNLLAFIAHMILDRGDRLYQRCGATTSRQELWHALRAGMRMLLVSSWSQMLRIYLDEDAQGP
jgi:hypothetical protein